MISPNSAANEFYLLSSANQDSWENVINNLHIRTKNVCNSGRKLNAVSKSTGFYMSQHNPLISSGVHLHSMTKKFELSCSKAKTNEAHSMTIQWSCPLKWPVSEPWNCNFHVFRPQNTRTDRIHVTFQVRNWNSQTWPISLQCPVLRNTSFRGINP